MTVDRGSQKAHGDRVAKLSLVVIAARVQVIGRSFKVLGNAPRAGKSEIRISSKCL